MNHTLRAEFPVTETLTYLDTAFIGPSPKPVVQAGIDFLERKSRGTVGGPSDWLVVTNQVRRSLAAFINARESEIAFTTNTTEGTNIVAHCLNLRPKDNVVWDDLDFPSNRQVWLHQAQTRGVENRVARSTDGAVGLADFERLVDDRTKVISVSYISHFNGFRHDLKALADLAHTHGAYLHVDAIQAVGAVKIDIKNDGVDFLTCGTYKWLLGPVGLAFFFIRQELLPQFAPVFQGWMQVKSQTDDVLFPTYELYPSARKFESATLHFQGIYELGEALNLLKETGLDKIEKQVLRLSAKLWQGLSGLGVELLTPPGTQSGVITCRVRDATRVAGRLTENRIVATVRGSNLRISPHFFNTEQEIDHLLDVIESA